MIRITITVQMRALLLIADIRLSAKVNRTMRLNAADCARILASVPERGRTELALRRRVVRAMGSCA